MPSFHVEAIDAEGRSLLGNLDGQRILRCRDFRKTYWIRALTNGTFRVTSRVHHWRVTDLGTNRVCATIPNPKFKET